MPLIIFFRTNLIHFVRKLKVIELNYNKYPAERCWLFLSKPDIASGFLSMQISFFSQEETVLTVLISCLVRLRNASKKVCTSQ